MLKINLPNVLISTKHKHCYNRKATEKLFVRVEGQAAWYKLTQGTDLAGFRTRLKDYHNNVILNCPGRTETYVQLHDQMLANYGSSLLN